MQSKNMHTQSNISGVGTDTTVHGHYCSSPLSMQVQTAGVLGLRWCSQICLCCYSCCVNDMVTVRTAANVAIACTATAATAAATCTAATCTSTTAAAWTATACTVTAGCYCLYCICCSNLYRYCDKYCACCDNCCCCSNLYHSLLLLLLLQNVILSTI